MANILIITNLPAPYRLPIYERIGEHHDVSVYYMEEGRESRNWEVSLQDQSFDYDVLDTFNLGPFWVPRSLVQKLREEDYDVVIVGDNARSLVATIIAAAYCTRSNSGFIIWTGGNDTTWKERGISGHLRKGLDLVRRLIYQQADVGLGYSTASERYLIDRGFDEEAIVTGTQFYPAELLDRVETTSESEGDEIVLYVGQLIERKAISQLLTMAENWPKSRTLQIAGTGPKTKLVENKASSTENIEYLGYISGAEKAKVMSEADVLVLPTNHDTWGFVTNEALYYGTPVVVTSAAGSSDLVSETGAGEVVDPGQRGVQEGIETVFSNLDEYTANAEAAGGYATDIDNAVDAFLEAIDMVVNRHCLV